MTVTDTTARTDIQVAYKVPAGMYGGCGHAWAAISKGEVVGLRYMSDHSLDRSTLPLWVQSIKDNAEGLDYRMMPTAYSSKGYAKLAAAARSCTDCPKSKRGLDIRPKQLLQKAVSILEAENAISFSAYRQKTRDELAELGTVLSGECSCTVFYVAIKHFRS